ncbi:MAG: 3-isopropylmalate dehydratase small subunit [Halioglobus sp.]
MEKFSRHEGVAAPLLRSNVDTDAIIPSREMKRVSKEGLGEGLFAGWRYLDVATREQNPEFILNRTGYRGASILLAGPNFGCGSSREHAVWALREFGFRAVIAPGFGAIFASNCLRNGILPLVLGEAQIAAIADWVAGGPQQNRVLIDLPAQQVQAGGQVYAFEIEPGARRMLVEGLDAIALTQTRWSVIEAFHQQRRELRPWLY